jgi:hypothetical protein
VAHNCLPIFQRETIKQNGKRCYAVEAGLECEFFLRQTSFRAELADAFAELGDQGAVGH